MLTAGWTNGALAVFNLLPAFPLDGGRVLRSVLWHQSGDKSRSTATAAGVGRTFGYGFIVLGGLSILVANTGLSGLWLAAIGWFVMSASRGEAESSTLLTELIGLHVGEAMTPDPLTVPDWVTLDRLWGEGVYRRHLSSFPVVDVDGAFAGLVTVPAIRRVTPSDWARTPVAAVASPPGRCTIAAPDDDLATVARAMSASPGRRAVVLHAGT